MVPARSTIVADTGWLSPVRRSTEWFMNLEEMIKASPDTPWKAVNEIKRLMWMPVIRSYFVLHGVRWGTGWSIYGLPVIQKFRGSAILIGDDFEMRNWFNSNPLGVNHPCILATWAADAKIEIGKAVGMSGARICAQTRVVIGDHVNLGANCSIMDTDFHSLNGRTSAPSFGASAEVILEGDNLIGMQTVILKGSRIGKGSIIGAGSVVAGEIPAKVVAAGNPARVIREL
ncbi:MAG: acyltransferase [Acidobacteria bacterium]|nr:MAG: acyltransferase [Acidobacteriota bacterium]